jgi:uncharacterized protein (DUF486 family)
MKLLWTILLLLLSNIFMTVAWYGHLKFKSYPWAQNMSLIGIIMISWGMAFFEYCLQVPANRIGSAEYGGPLSLPQLKVLQECITLLVFTGFMLVAFKNEKLQWNHWVAFACIVLAVYFVFLPGKSAVS